MAYVAGNWIPTSLWYWNLERGPASSNLVVRPTILSNLFYSGFFRYKDQEGYIRHFYGHESEYKVGDIIK